MKLFYALFIYCFSTYHTGHVNYAAPVRMDCEAFISVSDTLIQRYECDNYREYRVEKKGNKYYTSPSWYWKLEGNELKVFEIVGEHDLERKRYIVENIE